MTRDDLSLFRLQKSLPCCKQGRQTAYRYFYNASYRYSCVTVFAGLFSGSGSGGIAAL